MRDFVVLLVHLMMILGAARKAGRAAFRRKRIRVAAASAANSESRPYRYHRWQANLRVLDVVEIKAVPYAPPSHPFVERLIGTIRRECLDRTLFWTMADLDAKLRDFQDYYNHHRTHSARRGRPPVPASGVSCQVHFGSYRWRRHCGGLYQTPIAA